MILSESQVKEKIKSQPQKEALAEAVRHQNRILLHTASEIKRQNENPYADDFFGWVKNLLPEDKFQRFKQLIKTPYSTVGISHEIFSEYNRIFEGQNPFFNYEFRNPDDRADFNEYLGSTLKDRDFFSTRGFEQLRFAINSILVVDLPVEQEGIKPEPYYYFIDISSVVHVEVGDNGQIKTLIFKLPAKNWYAVYDSESYRKYKIDGEKIIDSVENAHDLGFCPCSFFWNWNLKNNNPIVKKSPFTDSLGSLDRFLALDTFKEHADLYSSFPIIVSIEEDCSFEGCQEGWIVEQEEYYYQFPDGDGGEYRYKNNRTKCPACEGRALIGAGTNFEIKARTSTDQPDIGKPVDVITVDVKPLEYLKEKLETIKNDIKAETIGSTTKLIDNQAINEMQVLGNFESRLQILIEIKTQFERIHKFANDTVAKLRYGNSFLSSVVFYGDEFYLKSIEALQEEYKRAKENGEPDGEIDSIYRKIIQYKYKGNPDKIERAWILLNLNPEPHKTVKESQELFNLGAISKTDFTIKARFNTFISRFEREQTSVISFGENLEFAEKISRIYNQLTIYANESEQIGSSEEAVA
jgi:hypothetical protein